MAASFRIPVRDFVEVVTLVSTVVDALRESSESSVSFRCLINELYALESVLLRVKRLDRDTCNHVEALHQAASQCQGTIFAFYRKVQRYQPHFQTGGTESKLKDILAKIKWSRCGKELETFRAQIRGHTSSIEILLVTTPTEATSMQGRKQNSHHKTLSGLIQDFSNDTLGLLRKVTHGIAQSVQQGKQLLETSAEIVQTNVRVFQVMHDIKVLILSIPGQVQRQQPVYLIDPLNKESPFHLEFVRSKEALLAVLKLNLKESGCGPAMIDRGDFAIEEIGTQSQVDLTQPCDICFYPGQKVAMSMIFTQDRNHQSSSCPRCGYGHSHVRGLTK